jgi:polyferredoxin
MGRKIFGKNFRLPFCVDIPMRCLKYLLLGFFLFAVLSMDGDSLLLFLNSPYYKIVDVKMLFFFTRMSAQTVVVLSLLVIASLFIRNFWRRYLCPYGALMGIAAFLSPLRIQRRMEVCVGCKRCSNACPSMLPVDRKQRIMSLECTGCMECTLACPVPNALAFTNIGSANRVWSPRAVGGVIVIVFLLVVLFAETTGHWHSLVPPNEARFWIQHIDSQSMAHP